MVRPTNILVTNNATVLSGCHAHNCYGGLIIGHHDKPIGGFMRLDGISRYLGDRKEALKFEKECKEKDHVLAEASIYHEAV